MPVVLLHNGVANRTIGLSEDAYSRLALLKREGETFSDVVLRLTGAGLLRNLAGSLDAKTAREMRDAIARGRRREDAGKRARVRRLGR